MGSSQSPVNYDGKGEQSYRIIHQSLWQFSSIWNIILVFPSLYFLGKFYLNTEFLFKLYSWEIKYFMYKMATETAILISTLPGTTQMALHYLWTNYNIYTGQADPGSFNYNLMPSLNELSNSSKTQQIIYI